MLPPYLHRSFRMYTEELIARANVDTKAEVLVQLFLIC